MEVYDVKIPKKRVAVLIGEKGRDKRNLEKLSKCKIDVNSEGEVFIKSEDNLMAYICMNIVKVIGRGCNPDVALSLLNENNCYEIINIMDYCEKSKNKLERIKGRVIGTGGKVRKNIEILTDTTIVVYGKTVCIVGKIEEVAITREAICDILKGAPFGPVYGVIERKIRKLKE